MITSKTAKYLNAYRSALSAQIEKRKGVFKFQVEGVDSALPVVGIYHRKH